MSTRKQRAANWPNGKESHGPTSPEGKAKSRFNALKHGIDAGQQIMFSESAEELAELAAEYHELHSPANADERFLVDILVNNEWRLHRLRRVEADLWRATDASSGDAFANSSPVFERLQRIVNSCERSYHRALRELQRLQKPAQAEDSTATSPSPGSFRKNSQPPAATANPDPESPESIAASFQGLSINN